MSLIREFSSTEPTGDRPGRQHADHPVEIRKPRDHQPLCLFTNQESGRNWGIGENLEWLKTWSRSQIRYDSWNANHFAKFPTGTDTHSVVKAESVAMKLAAACGLNAAAVSMTRAAGKDVLLIERFDRTLTENGWTRHAMVSALTMLGLDEMMARYASYQDLVELVRHRFTNPKTHSKSSTDGFASTCCAAILMTMPAMMRRFGTARC